MQHANYIMEQIKRATGERQDLTKYYLKTDIHMLEKEGSIEPYNQLKNTLETCELLQLVGAKQTTKDKPL